MADDPTMLPETAWERLRAEEINARAGDDGDRFFLPVASNRANTARILPRGLIPCCVRRFATRAAGLLLARREACISRPGHACGAGRASTCPSAGR